MDFVRNVWTLAKIAIPGWRTSEMFHLVVLSFGLVTRTILSIKIAKVNGKIVQGIVTKNWQEYIWHIATLAGFAIPSSLVNSGLEYLQRKLAILYRERLTLYFNRKYLSGLTYYQVTHLDDRVPNPDQRMTQDISKFSDALSNLWSNVSKPILDMALFSRELATLVGWEGPISIGIWYLLSGIVIKLISPAFSRLTVVEQELEGEYRACQSDLINYSEEITFYRGDQWERQRLATTYRKLRGHVGGILLRRFLMGIYDSVLTRYGAHICAVAVLALPVFGPRSAEYMKRSSSDPSVITRDYIRNFSLIVNLGKAIGRLVVSYKDIQTLAGFTHLTTKLKQVLEGLETGKYYRSLVNTATIDIDQRGIVVEPRDCIKFSEADIISPNGNELLKAMDFEIKLGQHVLINGPNGCGKSSLFRVMAGLWPLFNGALEKPAQGDIFYIAQTSYSPKGTFRDQLIYPDSRADMTHKGMTEADLMKLLDSVYLTDVYNREEWDSEKDWKNVLSGGEKQRMAMGRVVYHKPKFAILDECTSAVSWDTEGHLYELLKSAGITLITVSHRRTLLKHHDYVLNIEEEGKWSFSKVDKDVHVV